MATGIQCSVFIFQYLGTTETSLYLAITSIRHMASHVIDTQLLFDQWKSFEATHMNRRVDDFKNFASEDKIAFEVESIYESKFQRLLFTVQTVYFIIIALWNNDFHLIQIFHFSQLRAGKASKVTEFTIKCPVLFSHIRLFSILNR